MSSDDRAVPPGGGGSLLVLTDGRPQGRDLLALPFQDATVRTLTEGDIPDIKGFYHTIAIDRQPFALSWLDAAARRAVPALRADGTVIVMLGPADPSRADPGPTDPGGREPLPFGGLRWHGLDTVAGRPCAILTAAAPTDGPAGEAAGAPPAATAELLATANAALGLTAGDPVGDPAAPSPAYRRGPDLLARHLAARRRSEHALLAQLRAIAADRDRARHLPATALLRDLLGRSRWGRGLLRVTRPYRRLPARLRRRLRRADDR